MGDIVKGRGRPSKGPRHPFTVKLDLERAAKLKEILGILNTSGIEYLAPIIEAHVDAIDLHQLRNGPREHPTAVPEKKSSPAVRVAVRRELTQEEKFRRAQTLARKINLLLDARVDKSGVPYDYPAIDAGARKAGYSITRTRWTLLKNGNVQVVPDACLRAIATIFEVNPEYLLYEDAELPADLESMLPQVRIKRLSEVRDFAEKALGGPVDPEGLKALTTFLDQALQQ